MSIGSTWEDGQCFILSRLGTLKLVLYLIFQQEMIEYLYWNNCNPFDCFILYSLLRTYPYAQAKSKKKKKKKEKEKSYVSL